MDKYELTLNGQILKNSKKESSNQIKIEILDIDEAKIEEPEFKQITLEPMNTNNEATNVANFQKNVENIKNTAGLSQVGVTGTGLKACYEMKYKDFPSFKITCSHGVESQEGLSLSETHLLEETSIRILTLEQGIFFTILNPPASDYSETDKPLFSLCKTKYGKLITTFMDFQINGNNFEFGLIAKEYGLFFFDNKFILSDMFECQDDVYINPPTKKINLSKRIEGVKQVSGLGTRQCVFLKIRGKKYIRLTNYAFLEI